MVQFNLLPDIKVQYLKARQQKRMFMFISTVTVVSSLAVLILLASFVFGVQKKSISDLTKDIDSKGSELQNTEDLNQILTVQNQLRSLPDLHDQKPVATRLFGYISQTTPSEASIARINVSFVDNTMTISGSATTLETVNTFIDTLKFTQYKTASQEEDEEGKPAFSEVVLSTFGRDSKNATYTITTKFDPLIFSEIDEVTLVVPNVATTRSEVPKPEALFQKLETGQ
jgi:Tfp pilus assembly protein PilN